MTANARKPTPWAKRNPPPPAVHPRQHTHMLAGSVSQILSRVCVWPAKHHGGSHVEILIPRPLNLLTTPLHTHHTHHTHRTHSAHHTAAPQPLIVAVWHSKVVPTCWRIYIYVYVCVYIMPLRVCVCIYLFGGLSGVGGGGWWGWDSWNSWRTALVFDSQGTKLATLPENIGLLSVVKIHLPGFEIN